VIIYRTYAVNQLLFLFFLIFAITCLIK